MKVIAHTKYGVFESTELDDTKEGTEHMEYILKNLHSARCFVLDTDKGKIYFSKEMIADTLFILEN